MMKRVFSATVILFANTFIFYGQSKYTPQEQFFIDYSIQQDLTQTRLVLMNKKGNLAKLGEETINGKISGTLHYKTSVKGLKGIVTLTYTNYSDVEGWIFNGIVITYANMSADGTLGGHMVAEGLGEVDYTDLILKDGKVAGGNYKVTVPGLPEQDVNYELFFFACPHVR